MNYYDLINECIKSLRRVKGIDINLRNIVEIGKDESILLVCDTDNGNMASTDPWFGFKVLVPPDAFVASIHDIDAEAQIPLDKSLNTKAALRVAYYIYKAYKEAAKQIADKIK